MLRTYADTAGKGGSGATGANPTASVGLTAVNGVATTFLRSDGAPPLDQGIVPVWTGLHTFTDAGGVLIRNTAPILTLADTTASAKSLILKLDANVASFYEIAGSPGDILSLDLTNKRVGIGTAAPSADLEISEGTRTLLIKTTTANTTIFRGNSNQTSAGAQLAIFSALWNGTQVAQISLDTGINTVNKDDGGIRFLTSNTGGTLISRLSIDHAGLGIFNPTGLATSDFIIQGDTNASLFVSDASADMIGIGQAAPTALLHVGSGADTSLVASTIMIVTSAGATNLAIRDSTNDAELLNYIDGTTGIVGTRTNHPWTVRTDNTDRLTVEAAGNALFTAAVRSNSPTGGVGYFTGAGGTVTQSTSKSTAVTLNTVCGRIIMSGAALAAATTVSFTFTNSAISTNDRLVLNHVATGTGGAYTLNAFGQSSGSRTINVRNVTAGSLSEAIIIGFAVIRGVIA